jgi:hypothetical protein
MTIRHALLFGLTLIIGCSTTDPLSELAIEAPENAAYPGEQLPPPVALTLEGTPLWMGREAQYQVQGAPEGSTVYLYISERNNRSSCPSAISPVCLDLGNPTLVAFAVVDSDGIANLSRQIPGALRATSIWL